MVAIKSLETESKRKIKKMENSNRSTKRLHTRNRSAMRKTTCEGWGQKMRERDGLSFLKYLLIFFFFKKLCEAIIEIGGYTLH